MTVQENIAYGLERKRVPKADIRRRVGEMLEFMQLNGMESRYPVQLSGGQQQRVALGRSLVLKPKILLLDEPLAALDRKLRKDMQAELKRIQQEVGITFFYVTHDQKVALAISDTIAVMRNGKLEQVASPEEIYDRPKTRFVADFMGAANIFAGRVIDCGGEKITLEAESGIKIAALADKESGSNQIKGICVHPERIQVAPAGATVNGDNQFAGRIVGMIYQGDFVELKIRLLCARKHEDLTARLDPRLARRDSFAAGQEVIVQWDEDSSGTLQG
jgi:spermidine/putrescine transport system ATP-binding protein